MSHPGRHVSVKSAVQRKEGDRLANYLVEICPEALRSEGAWPHPSVPEVTLRRARWPQVVSGVPKGVTLQSGPFLLHAVTQGGEPVGGRCLQPWQRALLRE